VAQGLQLGTDLTGVDLAGLLAKLGVGTGNGTADGTKALPGPEEKTASR
jgi:flotillin